MKFVTLSDIYRIHGKRDMSVTKGFRLACFYKEKHVTKL